MLVLAPNQTPDRPAVYIWRDEIQDVINVWSEAKLHGTAREVEAAETRMWILNHSRNLLQQWAQERHVKQWDSSEFRRLSYKINRVLAVINPAPKLRLPR